MAVETKLCVSACDGCDIPAPVYNAQVSIVYIIYRLHPPLSAPLGYLYCLLAAICFHLNHPSMLICLHKCTLMYIDTQRLMYYY